MQIVAVAQTDTDHLTCNVSLDKDDAAVNREVINFLKTRFPQKDCNTCMQRFVNDEPWEEKTTTYVDGNATDVDREEFTKTNVTFRNKCQKGVRVLGIYKGKATNGVREYSIVWKSYPANFNGDYSRSSNDPIGGMFGDMLFGGGATTDINLRNIGHTYNNTAAQPGDIEWLRIIEENETSQSKIGANGEHTITVTSYTKATTISVKKGDKIYLHASGYVTTGTWSGASGPNGKVYTPLWNIEPGLNYGALMLKIGNGDYMATGTDTMIIAPNGGTLGFAVNDKDPTDNSGSFTVICSINKRLSKNYSSSTTSASAQRENSSGAQQTPKPPYNVKPSLPKKYRGYVTNTTYQKTSFSENQLSLNSDGSYQLTGSADNVNLFGEWELTGYETMKNGIKTYEFTGEIKTKVPMKNVTFNGKPAMKKANIPMTWTVEITEDGMKGNYHIAAYKQTTQPEEGTIDLH